MKIITSAEFRKVYPRIEEPMAVTALGRVIGHYIPIGAAIDDRFIAKIRPGEVVHVTTAEAGTMILAGALRQGTTYVMPEATPQEKRDAILRKINKGR